MSRVISRRLARAAGVLAAGAVAVVATALPASAHVTITPNTAAAGSYIQLSFNVPSESDTASTTKLDVQFPTGAPIASVSIQPKDGWTYTVKRGAPSHPVTDDDGDQITQVVDEITWTATPGSPGIKPGEFDTFVVSAGPLPTNVTSISFKALQTYSDNSVVRWIETAQPGQPEPQNPAPVLTLTATTGATATTAASAAGTASASRSDGTARGLGIAGIVVGALGLAAGAFGLATARRRARSGS